ncbi:MAG: peptidase [Bacteroidales bacterium]|nr:peptidase [Bacteroidales bacterium]
MSDIDIQINPIILLADSQLLFYKSKDGLFLDRIKKLIHKEAKIDGIKAAYIGASNNDDPQFFEIFELAMHQVDIRDCRMIKSISDKDDTNFLKSADIILLAGGDTNKGWEVIKRNGWDEIIIEKYSKGVILIGISAGAIQLGMKGYQVKENEAEIEFDTLKLVPFIIDVHTDDDWINLSKRIKFEGGHLNGYGIPYGGGLIYYPDMSLEAIRFPCVEILNVENKIDRSIILPETKEVETHEDEPK